MRNYTHRAIFRYVHVIADRAARDLIMRIEFAQKILPQKGFDLEKEKEKILDGVVKLKHETQID